MTKTEKLKQAYTDLKNGKIVEFINDDLNNVNVKCWIGNSNYEKDKRKYIFWHCYGSSANRMTLKDLRWIAKIIGHCTTYDYRIASSIYE